MCCLRSGDCCKTSSAALCDICMRFAILVLSMREAALTVSPKRQYLGLVLPTTEAMTGPECMPARILKYLHSHTASTQVDLYLMDIHRVHKLCIHNPPQTRLTRCASASNIGAEYCLSRPWKRGSKRSYPMSTSSSFARMLVAACTASIANLATWDA